ncbi:MAG: MBL fold metallo-hydrolase [Elusimicrobiota bacterium]|jgi:glyoxylase-like metal-dependent hydrolase (beta-lactamase superfamily II)|nr:MBL fold metallo-hydrolase [Elusimicrobiota bacterium]
MIKVESVVSGPIRTNCYLIYDSDTKAALIVDPGQDGDKVIEAVNSLGLKPEMLVNTHGHFDHIFDDDKIRKKFNIPLAVYKDEAYMLADPNKNASAFFEEPVSITNPEILLEDNQIVKLSFTEFKVIHTPGHTKGGICLLFDKFLITGDTLFKGEVGRTDLEDGSYQTLMQSLEKLKSLDPSLIIYPGHEEYTDLDYELKHNPYLKK